MHHAIANRSNIAPNGGQAIPDLPRQPAWCAGCRMFVCCPGKKFPASPRPPQCNK